MDDDDGDDDDDDDPTIAVEKMVRDILSSYLDEDSRDYVVSLLADDPTDEDALEAIDALITGSVMDDDDDDETKTGESVVRSFRDALMKRFRRKTDDDGGTMTATSSWSFPSSFPSSLSSSGVKNDEYNKNDPVMKENHNENNDDDGGRTDSSSLPRKLEHAVTLKEKDIRTFASGLTADGGDHDQNSASGGGGPSRIAEFYATMMDVSNGDAAISERARRKARQREIRLRMEEEERQRALKESIDQWMMDDDDEDHDENQYHHDDGDDVDDGDGNNASRRKRQDEHQSGTNTNKKNMGSLMDVGSVVSDVHLRSFELANLRGGGPNLLQGAHLTLARGRRYGLMGRNGCGKTTLLSYIANRREDPSQTGSVPRKMTMLLVRQEVIGNQWSAVQTVLKSDVRRESVKRFIAWCEAELERIDQEGKESSSTAPAASSTSNEEPTKHEVGGNDETTSNSKKKNAGSNSNSSSSKGRQKLRDRKKQSMQKAARQKAASAVASSPSLRAAAERTREVRKTKLQDKLGKAYQRLVELDQEDALTDGGGGGGGDPESRARKVLAGLGFITREQQDKPTSQLSGGWRMRVSLSCALFARPSLLLLDEPTNHLDLEAVLWLQRYLTTQFDGTLVVVSHDRHFLNHVVTDIVHFHRQQLHPYRGDVTNFEAVREEAKQRQLRLYETQEAKRAHLQKYIDLHAQAGENGVKAARQRKSKMKKLDKLGVMAASAIEGKKYKSSYDGDAEEVEAYREDEKVVLTFSDPGGFDGDIIRLERVAFGYAPDDILFGGVDLSINIHSRAALLGRNGSGKSSLIKLATGGLDPTKGKSYVNPRAKIEYLAQHQLEQLDPDGTPLLTLLDRYPGDGSDGHRAVMRKYLANFGLGGDVLPHQRIETLSGGQKCRVCLARALYRNPHLLILDEPTNHLDLETTDALIDALRSFRGGVLLVSHDQHLLTSVCHELYVVEKGRVECLTTSASSSSSSSGSTSPRDAFLAYQRAIINGRR